MLQKVSPFKYAYINLKLTENEFVVIPWQSVYLKAVPDTVKVLKPKKR